MVAQKNIYAIKGEEMKWFIKTRSLRLRKQPFTILNFALAHTPEQRNFVFGYKNLFLPQAKYFEIRLWIFSITLMTDNLFICKIPQNFLKEEIIRDMKFNRQMHHAESDMHNRMKI